MSGTEPSAQAWRRRYDDARVAVEDVARLLRVHARIAEAGGQSGASVAVLAGGGALDRATRVGMFAGSFNPLSVAHVAVAEAARAAQRLDTVVWAFSRVTVDKEGVERASLADRVVQVESYLRHMAPEDCLAVVGAGLYADQAAALATRMARGAELWLIVGFDKIVQIFDPHYYADREAALRRLFGMAHLLVGPRAGEERHDLDTLLARPENQPYAGRVSYLPLDPTLADVSSTAGRARLARATVAAGDLTSLLAPEGAALALETAAYAEPQPLATGEPLDRYWLRLAWLAALEVTEVPERPTATLPHLMALGSADDAAGAAARRWLRGERWPGAPSSLRELLALYDA